MSLKLGKRIDAINRELYHGRITREQAVNRMLPIAVDLNRRAMKRFGDDAKFYSADRLVKS